MTDNTQDRIRIAEAMGWKSGRTDTVAVMGRPIAHTRWIDPQGNDRAHCPDPFTDANDDYAVLEFMRNKCDVYPDFAWAEDSAAWLDFIYELNDAQHYQMGDYARAFLKMEDV